MKVLVESLYVDSFTSKGGNQCHVQTGYVYLFDGQGNVEKYPTRINLWLRAESDGQVRCHPVGEYVVDPRSFVVVKNSLAIQYMKIAPESKKAA